MKILTVQEYNEQVKSVYPQDWAQCHKSKGYIAIREDFKDGMWGVTKQSAVNKYRKAFAGFSDYNTEAIN